MKGAAEFYLHAMTSDKDGYLVMIPTIPWTEVGLGKPMAMWITVSIFVFTTAANMDHWFIGKSLFIANIFAFPGLYLYSFIAPCMC